MKTLIAALVVGLFASSVFAAAHTAAPSASASAAASADASAPKVKKRKESIGLSIRVGLSICCCVSRICRIQVIRALASKKAGISCLFFVYTTHPWDHRILLWTP